MRGRLCVAKGIHGQRAMLMLLALLLSRTGIRVVCLTVRVLWCAMQGCCKHYPCPHSCVVSRHAHCKSCSVCFCCSYSLTHGIPCYMARMALLMYLNDHALTSSRKPFFRCILPPTTILCWRITSLSLQCLSRFNALYTGALENLPMTS